MNAEDNDVPRVPTTTHLVEYGAWLKAADRPPSTIGLRCYHVIRLARDHADPLSLSTDDLVAWLAAHEWSSETRRSYRSSLRRYYQWAHMVQLIEHDPTAALPPIQHRPGVPRPAAEDRIFDALANSSERVRLMIMLGAHAGMRRGEIAKVHTNDIVPDLASWSLRVHGKGRRQRQVPLTAELARELRAQPAGFVFPSPGGGHLTAAHVGKLVSQALGDGLTSHTLRHRFATRAYAVNHDLLTVQQLLGHSKPETTMIYTRIPDAAKRLLVDAIAA